MQLCEVLQEAPHVRVLHLPHLACGMEGLRAVARLVETNPLMSLNLAGSLSSGTPVSQGEQTARDWYSYRTQVMNAKLDTKNTEWMRV